MSGRVCNFCGSDSFASRTTQYVYRRDGKYLFVDDVPCERCEKCGEIYYAASVLKRIEADFDAIQKDGRKAARFVEVPVESYPAI